MAAEVSPAAGLPAPEAAAAAPASVVLALGTLVRASLDEAWRRENSGEDVLGRLSELIELHLARLSDEVPEVGGEDDGSRPNEAACCACLKLARNLCVGSPSVQQYWWRRGLVQKLVARVRADLVVQGGSRHVAWREAVPTFVTNIAAGNADLRACLWEVLFPHDLAALCGLCWKRPEHAFMLTQNLIASSGGYSAHVQRLVETEDGHCFLFMLLSFLRGRKDEREGEISETALEWASVFFHGLWLAGRFARAYRGMSGLTAARLHSFLGTAAGVGGGGSGAETWTKPPLSIGFWRLVEGLCGHEEARCLLWHTVHGLLSGPVGQDLGPRTASLELAKRLLGDEEFVELAAADMCKALALLAQEWGLEWNPLPVSAEACAALGIMAEDVDVFRLASLLDDGSSSEDRLVEHVEDRTEEGQPEEPRSGSIPGAAPAQLLFQEALQAAVELAAVPRLDGVVFPPRLAGVYLTGNIAFIDALHRLRFGVDVGAPQRSELSPRAAEAARACQLVDQLRLCGNVLYGQPPAQDFLRLTGGLRVLLSHCYSDHELPLLREAGIFAVRNATHLNAASQGVAKNILAEKRAAACAGERLVEDLGLER